jgi:CBS domain containing-hemolysin-like protein
MTVLLVVLLVWFVGSLVPVTFVQVLYLESLRLRKSELPALAWFKEHIEPRLNLKPARGALTFSLVKHTSIVLLGVVVFGLVNTRGASAWQSLAEASLASWLLMLAVSYVIPQTFYRRTEGRWLAPLVPLLRMFAISVRPLILVLEFFQSVVELRDVEEAEEAANQVEHIDALITAGTEEGLIEEEDRKLIHAAVAFGDKTVREVMTPRPKIVSIDACKSLEDLRELVINEQYSRIPVYEGSIDHIIGFVHVRDMFELDEEERARRTVRELMRPVRLVPETKPVQDLMKEMQEDRAHVAIVIDEYGNTAGLATMEDLVEEILGEIRDEHEPEMDVTEDQNGGWIVAGSCDLDRLEDLLGFRPEEGTESTTVGGLAAEWLGRVPKNGETVERDGIRMEVLAANDLRVEQLRIRRANAREHE